MAENLNLNVNDFPVAGRLQNEVMSLPLYPEITIEQQRRVVETLKKAIDKFK
jgi:dTDP-4-amino-4,6-dideoxygalactose transaminase